MTQLEMELAALRARRRSPGLYARLRSMSLFDRRAIREPDERDAYWLIVQRRLAESDPEFRLRHIATEPPPRPSNDYASAPPLLLG